MKTIISPLDFFQSEANWIESESLRVLNEKVTATQIHAFAAIVLFFLLLFGYTSQTNWLVWMALHVLVIGLRFWFVSNYHTYVAHTSSRAQTIFYSAYSFVIALFGFSWGSSAYMVNGNEPSLIASVCFNFILVYGVVGTINVSSHLASLNYFLNGFSFGLLGSLIVRLLLKELTTISFVDIVLFLGCTLLVVVLRQFGKKLNQSYLSALKLQFNNQRLIATLTHEKQIAIDAVASKNRMLASAAHDMRQPVLALDIYAGWLADEPSSSVDIAPKIIASTKAVIDLFDSMFDMSRLSEGEISTRMEGVNLYELISELFVHYQPLAKSKNLSLKTRTIEGTVFTDYILLTRILGNLISNAIKYTQTGGVLIACRNTAQGIDIEVWDTGVGIETDQQALVFKEFYKNPSNPGTSDGFGLGLAIVTQLADLIGAKLTLRSRRGRGTVVSLKLGKMI
jgi:signal transduction histidine kinase